MGDNQSKAIEMMALNIPIPAAGEKTPYSLRRSRPLLGILVLAVVVAAALPLVNITVIFPAYTKMLVAAIETGAERLARHTILPSATYGGLSNKTLDSPRFLADIYRLEKDFELFKLCLFSPEGTVLYSTDSSEIATINKAPDFLRVVAKGGTASHLVPAVKPVPGGGDQTVDTVLTTVPIMRDHQFLGAFQFQFDISDVKGAMDQFNTYATYGSIITSLCILLGVIVLLCKEKSRLHALRRADRLKADVEQITRHDLKTPLVSALNGISYIEQYTQTDEEQREILGEMHNAVIVGLDLINRGLDLYKMETGRYEYTTTAVDITAVSRRVAADLAGQAAQKGVTIRIRRVDPTSEDPAPLPVSGEETLCYSLLANLVKNGIEASENNREVTLSLSANHVGTIRVHNTGTVPESIRATFFDKFATAGKRGGTGLGTYSASLLTRTMGGDITMDSSEEDGTTITVTLPLHNDTETGD